MKSPRLPTDELFQVERLIARRADELARRFGSDPAHALEHWRQAEREIWHDESGELAFAESASPMGQHATAAR